MMGRTQKSIRMLYQYVAVPEKRKALAQLYTNIIAYPKLQAHVEAANIKEVKKLCKDEASIFRLHDQSESNRTFI